MRKFQSGTDRLIVVAQRQARQQRWMMMIAVGPFFLLALGLVVFAIIVGITHRRAPAPRPTLTGSEACLTYDIDTVAGYSDPIDAFVQSQGLTEQQSANLARECANYECEPLAEAAAAVKSPGWSGLPDPAKHRYAGPCG